jgi:hypothetical protein
MFDTDFITRFQLARVLIDRETTYNTHFFIHGVKVVGHACIANCPFIIEAKF